MKKLVKEFAVALLGVLLLSVFVVSAGQLVSYLADMKSEGNEFEELRKEVNIDADDNQDGLVLQEIAALYEENSDTIGWISIEGTSIDYPVMYTPNEYDYYLNRSFSKEESRSGVPFLGEKCTIDSDNIIVHGHNMKTGAMFSDLTKYKDKSYYEEHSTIIFKTLYEEREYKIISAFESKAFGSNEEGFRYYEEINFNSESEFDSFVKNVKDSSLYTINESIEYGDKFITLSTCAYHEDDGRFVIIGKQVN